MTTGSSDQARKNILGRIRRARGRGASRPSEAELEHLETYLEARRRGPIPRLVGDLVELFRERAESMQSTTEVVPGESAAPAALARYLDARGLPRAGCMWLSLAHIDWRGGGLDMQARPAHPDDAVGVTGAFAALAETGTLMLLSGPDAPATVSLLPETHIAIVPASRVVAHMEDAWDMARAACGVLPRAVTFISGPSRTGDIEQKMVLGAHGPRNVHIVIVRSL
jgi:L-lactate dehydrogenase complex protein LldG